MTDEREGFAKLMVKSVGASQHLEELLRAGERAVSAHGYSVDIVTRCDCSRIEHDSDPFTGKARGGRIFICAEAKANAAWDFLHELGHALNGHEPGRERNCGHETQMWVIGWDWATAQNGGWLTTADRFAFIARAEACLASYCKTPPVLRI